MYNTMRLPNSHRAVGTDTLPSSRLFNLNLCCSASGIFAGMNILSIDAIRRKCMYNYMQTLNNSANAIINVFMSTSTVLNNMQ